MMKMLTEMGEAILLGLVAGIMVGMSCGCTSRHSDPVFLPAADACADVFDACQARSQELGCGMSRCPCPYDTPTNAELSLLCQESYQMLTTCGELSGYPTVCEGS